MPVTGAPAVKPVKVIMNDLPAAKSSPTLVSIKAVSELTGLVVTVKPKVVLAIALWEAFVELGTATVDLIEEGVPRPSVVGYPIIITLSAFEMKLLTCKVKLMSNVIPG